jgi:glycine hydroxymethyltransferase
VEEDFRLVADLIHEGVQLSKEAKGLVGSPKVKDYLEFLESPDFPLKSKLEALREKVETFASAFPIPGESSQ